MKNLLFATLLFSFSAVNFEGMSNEDAGLRYFFITDNPDSVILELSGDGTIIRDFTREEFHRMFPSLEYDNSSDNSEPEAYDNKNNGFSLSIRQ